ncbi:hypothetical protein ACJX0J_039437, partial [Zea mays]
REWKEQRDEETDDGQLSYCPYKNIGWSTIWLTGSTTSDLATFDQSFAFIDMKDAHEKITSGELGINHFIVPSQTIYFILKKHETGTIFSLNRLIEKPDQHLATLIISHTYAHDID